MTGTEIRGLILAAWRWRWRAAAVVYDQATGCRSA
jgi:hypothetical protein